VAGVVKIPENILLGETGKQNDNIQISVDKSTIEVGKSEKGLNIFKFSWLGPVLDDFDFVIGHSEPKRRKDISKVFY